MKTETREHQQFEFMKKNKIAIVEMAMENKNTIGYVELYADDDFNLLKNTLRFVASDFNKKSFTRITLPHPTKSIDIIEAEFIYYAVLWCDNKTKWQVKELVLIGTY